LIKRFFINITIKIFAKVDFLFLFREVKLKKKHEICTKKMEKLTGKKCDPDR